MAKISISGARGKRSDRVRIGGDAYDLPGGLASRWEAQAEFMRVVRSLPDEVADSLAPFHDSETLGALRGRVRAPVPDVVDELYATCYPLCVAAQQLSEESNPTIETLPRLQAARKQFDDAVDTWAAIYHLDAPWCKAWAHESLATWHRLERLSTRLPPELRRPRLSKVWAPPMHVIPQFMPQPDVFLPPAFDRHDKNVDAYLARAHAALKRHLEGYIARVTAVSLPTTPSRKKDSLRRHSLWLACVTILGWRYEDISTVHGVMAASVSEAVLRLAELIELPFEPPSAGRPPKWQVE